MIESVNATLYPGTNVEISFTPVLNIVAGPNGAGKTKLLTSIATARQNNLLRHNPSTINLRDEAKTARVAAFSSIRSLQKTP